MDVYNEAWGHNWGFVPITEDEVALPGQEPEAGARRELGDDRREGRRGRRRGADAARRRAGARADERAAAAVRLVALPAPASATSTGCASSRSGVKDAYQHLGVAAALYERHVQTAASVGPRGGHMGWILETNEPMNRAMEGMGGRVVQRYRIYERALGKAPLDKSVE